MAAPASPRPVVADLQLVTPEKSTSAAKQAEHDLERMQSPPLNQVRSKRTQHRQGGRRGSERTTQREEERTGVRPSPCHCLCALG